MAKQLPATPGGFPLENVDPAQKRKKPWLLQYARAALGMYDGLNERAIGWRSRDRYDMIRKYGQARQPLDKYLALLTPDADNDNNGLNKMVVDDHIIPVIPKVRRDIISLLTKANENYYITIDPIDPLAASEMEDEAANLKAKVIMRQTLKMAGMQQLTNSPAVAPQPNEPDDLEGAEVAVLGLRHKAAMKSELVVQQVLNSNKYPDLREWISADYVDYGVAAVKDETEGCRVKLRKVDMRGFIISNCIKPDFSDWQYMGEIQEIPVSKVVEQSNGQVDKDELAEIYKIGNNNGTSKVFWGGPDFGGWDAMYLRGMVRVLDLCILTTDTETREERKNKYGNTVFGKAEYGTKPTDKRKIHTKKCQNIYCVKWIVGTDICYDMGPARDLKLDPNNPSRVMSPYHVFAGDIYDMVAYSRTENLISFADAIQLRRMKMQHIFNTAVPNGHLINLTALEEIAINAGGAIMTPKDILALYWTRGDILWRSESLTGDDMLRPPIEPIINQVSEVLAEYANDIIREIQMMKDSVGLNEVTDSSAPDPKRSNPATAAAITGTNNALADLFSADRRMTISVSEGSLIRAQTLFKLGKGEEFAASLGAATVSFLKAAPSIDRYRFGITITDRPTAEQVQGFEDELQKAVASGQLGIDDVAIVRSMKNLKEREAYLVYKVRKNRDEAQQKAIELQQQNGNVQIQSAQAAEEAKRQTLTHEYKLRADLSAQEHKQKMDELVIPVLGKNEDNRIAATGRISAAQVQGQAKDESSIRQATAKLIGDGHTDKVDMVSQPADLKTDVEPLTSAAQPIVPGIEQLQQKHFSFLAPPVQNQQPADEPQPTQEPQDEMQEEQAAEDPAMGAEAEATRPNKEQLMSMLSGV